MSDSDGAPGEVLPCGRSGDALVEQVFAGRAGDLDAHQRECVHCRAALAEAATLWAPLSPLAGRLETAPGGLVDAVMAAVRAMAGEVWHVVVPGDRGATRISGTVVAKVAQRAARGVSGVRVALGRHRAQGVPEPGPQEDGLQDGLQDGPGHGGAGGWVGVAGRRVVVDLAVVVAFGASIPDVADAVRRAVRRDLAALAAVQTAQVDIHVDDVLPGADGA